MEDVDDLRRLVTRLRALAMREPTIADRLRRMADEADDRADGLAASLLRRRSD